LLYPRLVLCEVADSFSSRSKWKVQAFRSLAVLACAPEVPQVPPRLGPAAEFSRVYYITSSDQSSRDASAGQFGTNVRYLPKNGFEPKWQDWVLEEIDRIGQSEQTKKEIFPALRDSIQ
jgi:hypothetical protein